MKHKVRILVSFIHEIKVGALMAGDKEIAPAQMRKTEYVEGNLHLFPSKKEALSFCKFHGFDKVTYLGK